MEIKVVVAAMQGSGPDFFALRVKCSNYQFTNGDHYDAAREAAAEEGYDSPMVVFDEKDGPRWLFSKFDWSTLPLEDIEPEGDELI